MRPILLFAVTSAVLAAVGCATSKERLSQGIPKLTHSEENDVLNVYKISKHDDDFTFWLKTSGEIPRRGEDGLVVRVDGENLQVFGVETSMP